MQLWAKFRLLLWKNWLIQRRHPWQSALEIVVPVLCTAVLVLLRSLVRVVEYPDEWHYPAVSIDAIPQNTSLSRLSLFYTPPSPVLNELVGQVAKALNIFCFHAVDNATALERILLNNPQIFAGIEFAGDNQTYAAALPQRLRYALRFPAELRSIYHNNNPLLFNWQTDKSIVAFQEPGPRTRNDNDGGIPPGYICEGFVAVQHAIAAAFVRQHNDSAGWPTVRMRRFPYPPFRLDMLINGLELVMPVILVVSFIYPCIALTKTIALEKERQMKEAMQIMGLPGWLHWAGWWARAVPTLWLTSGLLVVLLKVRWSAAEAAVMSFSSWSLLLAFLGVYALTTVAFCCMMSVFFAQANVSAAIAGIVWFASYLVYQFVEPDDLGLGALLVLCLISNTGMAFGVLLMLRFEAAGQGSDWRNVFQTYSVDNDLTVGYVMLMMLAAAALYMLIALYVEQIRPGEFGVARVWYFPVQPSFWRTAQRWRKVELEGDVAQDVRDFEPDGRRGEGDRRHGRAGSVEENENTNLRAGVQIRGLQKTYGLVRAVMPMDLDMFEDQITVLLGHNGAGKTTTMSMLTGMIRPSAGTAYVNGYDIRYDIGAVRGSLGLCPQHNILFDDLTVLEHLEFFTRLKGVREASEVQKECAKYLKLIGLEAKARTAAAALSGGMKRKLGVCVAFCGGSKVVFCDEPSSGMDPAARRALWDFIRQEKRGRTVMLSTHFMDEADVLGDRIAILNAGELKCCGSPYFLKKRYGVGYHLVCTKASVSGGGNAEQMRILTAVLQRFNAGVTVARETATEVSFRLPDAMQPQFERVFEDLERHYAAYGLQTFGVSLTTLEDVFMNVGSDATTVSASAATTTTATNAPTTGVFDKVQSSSLSTLASSSLSTSSDSNATLSLLTGWRLWLSQTRALFRKRYLQTVRGWVLLLVQICIPAVFVIATVLIEFSKRQFGNLPRLDFDLNMYASSVTLLQEYPNATHATYDAGNAAHRFSREYSNVVHSADPTRRHHQLELVPHSDGISTYLLRLSRFMLVELNRLYYVAADISPNGENITAWFNNQPYHAAPLSLQLVHSAIVRSQLGANYSIHATNAPLPYSHNALIKMVALAGRLGVSLGLNIAFAMAFAVAFFVLPLVREQANRAKLLQFVSGAKVLIYWGTALLWDYAVMALICALLLGVVAAFQEYGWSSAVEIGRVAVVLAAFGWATLPVTYLAARLFVVPTAAFTIVTIVYLAAGVVMPITVTALEQYDERAVADALTGAFLLMPHFALNACLRYAHEITQRRRLCEVICEVSPDCTGMEMMCRTVWSCCEFEYFAWQRPGMAEPLVYLAAVGAVGMVLIVVIEMRWLEALWFLVWERRWSEEQAMAEVQAAARARRLADEVEDEDEDVLEERHRVHTMSMYEIRSQSLVVKDLSKTYRRFCAVNRISVAVDSAECFGLLGINGAGKTSTFKMLTGDLRCSAGQAWLRGIPLRTQMTAVHRIIGYCPQFDALIDEMTCREVLHLFGRLRGLRSGAQQLDRVVAGWAADLNFGRHLDKAVAACSGGNRRKLSTAVALIGRPAVVYLDEPTTGMDPCAKRQLWDVVQRQQRAGTAIVLTSHSMDECEALCTRLAIMVNGEFRCLGSVQHLKSKFARGFVLMVRVSGAAGAEDVRRVEAFVAERFRGAVLQNRFHTLLTYHIPSDPLRKWSRMFGIMNAGKIEMPMIEDYALSQTSLEQVFLSFTERQNTADNADDDDRPSPQRRRNDAADAATAVAAAGGGNDEEEATAV